MRESGDANPCYYDTGYKGGMGTHTFIFYLLHSGAGIAACSPFYTRTHNTMTRKEKLKFYHSTAWKYKSKYIMQRDHYECQECRKRIKQAADDGMVLSASDRKIARATQVHHIVPYDINPSLGLDDDNLEAICDKCHNIIHGRVWNNNPNAPRKRPATVERW